MDSSSILNAIASVGSLEQIEKLAAQNFGLDKRPAVNSHIHLPPNFSAFDTVSQAIQLASEQKVQIVGLSNYYDYAVYEDFGRLALQKGIFPLFGLEIIAMQENLRQQGVKVNDPGNPGKTYICGKGITQFQSMTPRAKELIHTIRDNDNKRMTDMTQKLAGVFESHGVKTGLDDKAVIARVAKRHGCDPKTVYLQERHLAQAFQEVFFEKVPAAQRKEKLESVIGTVKNADDAVGIQGQIRSSLMKAGKSCFAPEAYLTLNQAKELILELGGIVCYPVLADGAAPGCEYETPVEKLIGTLQSENISMVELVPIRNNPEVLRNYVTAIRKVGIAVVAGTEHNTLDVIAMEPTCLAGTAVPDDLKEIFAEGAYIAAAHQYLALNGKCGFVDNKGKPNPQYKDAQSRIVDLCKIGKAVIAKYLKTSVAS
jgi:transposase-like protein